jgi:CheY-like chemotaxis protein
MPSYLDFPRPAEARAGDTPDPPASLNHVLLVAGAPLAACYLKTALQLHGFTVWSAASGADALRLLGEHPRHLGLALIDRDLPDLACAALLAGLRRLNPDLRCCVMGADDPEEDAALRAAGAVHVVRKPLALADLSYSLWGLQRPVTFLP